MCEKEHILIPERWAQQKGSNSNNTKKKCSVTGMRDVQINKTQCMYRGGEGKGEEMESQVWGIFKLQRAKSAGYANLFLFTLFVT